MYEWCDGCLTAKWWNSDLCSLWVFSPLTLTFSLYFQALRDFQLKTWEFFWAGLLHWLSQKPGSTTNRGDMLIPQWEVSLTGSVDDCGLCLLNSVCSTSRRGLKNISRSSYCWKIVSQPILCIHKTSRNWLVTTYGWIFGCLKCGSVFLMSSITCCIFWALHLYLVLTKLCWTWTTSSFTLELWTICPTGHAHHLSWPRSQSGHSGLPPACRSAQTPATYWTLFSGEWDRS